MSTGEEESDGTEEITTAMSEGDSEVDSAGGEGDTTDTVSSNWDVVEGRWKLPI